jgi:two-component system phosphate regulon sensor histidine kinase PhoR
VRRDFIANVSHELRSPLTSLAGFVETLLSDEVPDLAMRTRFLTIMDEEAKRMSRLIDDLLSLSRVEVDEHIIPGQTGESS